MERRLAAVLIADAVGYSRLSETDEEGTRARFEGDLHRIFEPKIAEHHGRLIKTMGDGLLVEFQSVVHALRCAVDVQHAESERNAGMTPDKRLEFRIAVNLGDVIVEGDDIHGNGVNIADRLQAMAKPGGVIVSGTAYDQVSNNPDLRFDYRGEHRVKNISTPVRVYEMRTGAGSARPLGVTRRWAGWPRRWRGAAIGAVILAVIVAGAAVWLHPWRLSAKSATELASAVTGGKPSLVVLPFENLSDNKQQEFFVDGLTEDLITDLSNLSGIFVISRNTAFTYKNQTTRPTQIAKDLGVAFVVNGSVRRDAGRVRITAELIDALHDRQVWAQRYDRDLIDVFAVEDEVKKEIVQSLAVKFGPGEQKSVASAPTKNIEAYDYYLRGRLAMNSLNPGGLALAHWAFEKAIALDPDFAEAYASLALANVIDLTRESSSGAFAIGAASPESLRSQAAALAQRAASLRPSLSIPDIVSARLSLWDGRYNEAIDHARRAVEHEPGNVDAYLTQALVLTAAGLHRDAKAAIDQVFRRDPKPSAYAYGVLGIIQFALRDKSSAIANLETCIRQSELLFGGRNIYPAFLFAAYGEAGSRDKAQALTLGWGETINNWDLSLVRSQEFYRRAEDTAYLLDGLRKAGAPEFPLGFDPKTDAGEQLVGSALGSSLPQGSFHPRCSLEVASLTVRFASNGTISWKLRDDITDSGKFRIDRDKLYLTLPVLTRNRETLFLVYRNADTSKIALGHGYDFVLVGPFLCFFSPDK
jgi:adenylate cyclase